MVLPLVMNNIDVLINLGNHIFERLLCATNCYILLVEPRHFPFLLF